MIAIIFPPQWVPNHPYLAPFLLCSRVRAKGVDCRAYDLNLYFYRNIISKEDLATFNRSQLFFNASIYGEALQKANSALGFENSFASIDVFNAHFQHKVYKSEELWRVITDKDNFFSPIFLENLQNVNLERCEVLGISTVAYSQIVPSLTLAYIAKQLKPDVKIIIGGDMISRIGNDLRKKGKIWQYVDAIICGDGEYAIDSIAEFIKKGRKIDFRKVPNAVTKHNEDKLKRLPFDLAEYRIADYSDADFSNYLSPFPIITLEMSRGCYWSKCAYCETTEIPFRLRNVIDVVDEVEVLCNEYAIKHFSFSDLALPPNEIFKFATEVNKRKLRIYWKGMIRAEKTFAKKNVGVLYESGCRMVLIGIESANCDILNKINKGIELSLVPDILKNFKENNIWVHGYFIIDFPGETKNQIMETLDFILLNNQNLNSFCISRFVLLRDSNFFRNPEFFKIQIHKNQNDDLRTAHFRFDDGVSYDFGCIQNKIKEVLEAHPYDYRKWKDFDINYLFLYVTQKGANYFMKGVDSK